MKPTIRLLHALFVLVLAPFVIVAFAGLGGIDAMSFVVKEYFCDPGLTNCSLFLVEFVENVIAYWWFVALALHTTSAVLVAFFILFDTSDAVWRRLAWFAGIFFASPIATPIYCFVRLRQLRASQATSVAA